MASITAFLTAFGLASSAGLNAFIPLLVTGVVARYTELVTLPAPFDMLENQWVLLTLSVLLVIEMTADKIAAVDTLNDIIHTFIRPTAGAILFAAQSGQIGIDPIFAIVLGLLAAGGVHATKAAVRPVVTATTAGLGNPVVSVVEDIVSLFAAILAILAPVVAALALVILLGVVLRWWGRRRDRRVTV